MEEEEKRDESTPGEAQTAPPREDIGRLAQSVEGLRRARGVATVFRLIALVVVVVVAVMYYATVHGRVTEALEAQDEYLEEQMKGFTEQIWPEVRMHLRSRFEDEELRQWVRETGLEKIRAAGPDYRAVAEEQAQLLRKYVLETTTEQLEQKLAAKLAETESRFTEAFPELTEQDVDLLMENLDLSLTGGTESALKSRMEACAAAVESLGGVVDAFPIPERAPDDAGIVQRIIQIVFELMPYSDPEELGRVRKEFEEIHWPALRERLAE